MKIYKQLIVGMVTYKVESSCHHNIKFVHGDHDQMTVSVDYHSYKNQPLVKMEANDQANDKVDTWIPGVSTGALEWVKSQTRKGLDITLTMGLRSQKQL